MLSLHAAWSRSLCSGPSGASRKAGAVSPRGTSKASGTKDRVSPARRPRAACARTRGRGAGRGPEQSLGRGQRAVAQARDRRGPARGQGAAEVVDGDLVAGGAPGGVDEAPERVERGAAAGEHDGARLERVQRAAEAARVERQRQGQDAQAATAQAQLERLRVQGVHVARRAGVEDEHAVLAGGGGRDARGRGQPAGGPAPREAVLGRGALPRGRGSRRRAGAPPRRCARPSAPRGSPPGRGRRRPRRSGRTRCAGATAWPGRRRARAPGRRPRRCCGSPRRPSAAPRSR